MLFRLVFTTRINAKAAPTNNTDYNCYIKLETLFNQSYSVHIMPLAINNLGGGDTHTHTHTHTHRRPNRINFKKPGTHMI